MDKCLVLRSSVKSMFWQNRRVLNFHTTPAACIDQKWRKANRLGPNPTSEGVLVHAPDYSFVDGRETPISSNQLARLKKQRQYATQMVEMIGELEFAKTRLTKLQQAKEDEKQKIISGKLKQKGHLLLKK